MDVRESKFLGLYSLGCLGVNVIFFFEEIIAENVIEYFLEIKYWNFIIMLWQLDEQNIL